MIDEGQTIYCSQCEVYAQRIEKLEAVARAAERLIYPPRTEYARGSKKALLKAALEELKCGD